MLFGGVRKRFFVLIIDRAVRGQLALYGVDPLDEPLNFAFRTAVSSGSGSGVMSSSLLEYECER